MTITFDKAALDYMQSKKFCKLSFNTKRIYSDGLNALEELRLFDYDIKAITRPKVIEIRDELYDMPGKCRIALIVLSNVLKHCYDHGWVDKNHAERIGDLPPQKGYVRWSDAEIDRFIDTAPAHLKAVMMLALYTGQRRSDLAKMRWADLSIDDKGRMWLYVKQRKTGIELSIPVHPKLRTFLEAMPKPTGIKAVAAQDRILTNYFGQPWIPDNMRQAVKRHSAKIGLVDRSLHGIRKTTASVLAEMGCDALRIGAITGHVTLKELQRYTEGAERKKMAEEAMAKWQ